MKPTTPKRKDTLMKLTLLAAVLALVFAGAAQAHTTAVDYPDDAPAIVHQGHDHTDLVDGTFHGDVIFGRAGEDDLRGSRGGDDIYGGRDADRVAGDAGADAVYGGRGPDAVVGGAGVDACIGGPGRDIFYSCEMVLDFVVKIDTFGDFVRVPFGCPGEVPRGGEPCYFISTVVR